MPQQLSELEQVSPQSHPPLDYERSNAAPRQPLDEADVIARVAIAALIVFGLFVIFVISVIVWLSIVDLD
jgi:hypothetical protein